MNVEATSEDKRVTQVCSETTMVTQKLAGPSRGGTECTKGTHRAARASGTIHTGTDEISAPIAQRAELYMYNKQIRGRTARTRPPVVHFGPSTAVGTDT